MRSRKSVFERIALVGGLVCFCNGVAFSNGIDILVEGNESLQNVDGLSGVISLNSLVIKSNLVLKHLDGLRYLDKVTGALDIQTNEQLSNCKGLAPVLGWPDGEDQNVGSVKIAANCSGLCE